MVAYHLLTFAISWRGILFVVGGPAGIPGSASDLQRLMPLAIPFMLFGPTIAVLTMTGFLDGCTGYRQLWSHLIAWRSGCQVIRVRTVYGTDRLHAGSHDSVANLERLPARHHHHNGISSASR